MGLLENRIGVLCLNRADMPRGEPDFPYEGRIGDHEELGLFVTVGQCLSCGLCPRAEGVREWLEYKILFLLVLSLSERNLTQITGEEKWLVMAKKTSFPLRREAG